MQTEYESPFQGLNYLIDSFWAAMPEKTADDIAKFKKDVLTRVKDAATDIDDDHDRCMSRMHAGCEKTTHGPPKIPSVGPCI